MRPQGQTVGYVRVSSADQNLARQLDSIGQVDRVFEDKVSGGSRTQRQGLADCLRYIRDGDVVRVASMDRLARSLVDLQQIVDEILATGCRGARYQGEPDLHVRGQRIAHPPATASAVS